MKLIKCTLKKVYVFGIMRNCINDICHYAKVLLTSPCTLEDQILTLKGVNCRQLDKGFISSLCIIHAIQIRLSYTANGRKCRNIFAWITVSDLAYASYTLHRFDCRIRPITANTRTHLYIMVYTENLSQIYTLNPTCHQSNPLTRNKTISSNGNTASHVKDSLVATSPHNSFLLTL